LQVELTDKEFEKLLVDEDKQKKDGKRKKKHKRIRHGPRSRILNRRNDRTVTKAREAGDEVNFVVVIMSTAQHAFSDIH